MQHLDGWLLTDLAATTRPPSIWCGPSRPAERRWFYLIPARGDPLLIAHVGDAAAFGAVPGKKTAYATWRDLGPTLKVALKGRRRVAMELGQGLALPTAFLEASVAEAVRTAGARVVSSGNLRLARARWDARAREQHLLALAELGRVRDEAVALMASRLQGGKPLPEVEVEKKMLRSLRVRGLETDVPPTVAAGPNSAQPGYMATNARTELIRRGDVVLLRLTGKVRADGAPYASITHVVYTGNQVPDAPARAFAAARAAADAAVALVREHLAAKQPLYAHEVDAAARKVLADRGFGPNVLHPVGHALERHYPGNALALDDYDARDDRVVQRGLGLRIAPGVYVASQFGVQCDRNVFLGERGLEVTSAGQSAVQALFAPARSELLELP